MPIHDLVVFGATSFVGSITCAYLLKRYPPGNQEVSWAIAGRSHEKLSSLRAKLGPAGEKLAIIVADASDQQALSNLCQQTRVVISTVGPYALYGEALVKACVTAGTDYCDLTGEPQWIAKMLRRYEKLAQINGSRIIHCCGFDSVPSDLGVLFIQKMSLDQLGSNCKSVKMRVKALKGAASGGTVASMMNIVKESAKSRELRQLLANPYALCPAEHNFSAHQQNLKMAEFDLASNSWIAPFIMAAINTKIVFRSNALMHNRYGDDFTYDEAMMMGSGTAGCISASALSIGLLGFMLVSALPPSRWFLEKVVLPKPGEGPSDAEQQDGYYDLRFFGQTPDGLAIQTKVTGDQDPGYGSTAKILSETALCLLLDQPKAKLAGGFWTPASALGESLIDKLEHYAGMTFSIEKMPA
ncbi:saccharopine dehydrogenase NADP-binding domain-containing protein [Aliiglaciecola sp. LCG003]|uniref:saccharopine dehydrogenase family protein n=1 Tax=Aliiglaciecola sp. LCG003 TaxID=3053655 RepID=UPI0025727663|nr:saccharopine dehydrogenase NADP-binding domain-containing protein [Aliiglaciecola sp. LCG003]WJG07987.1 saccharopine dehydrogenase NADP-binding domain-containing protein [Aliiglaciecola sp. LCG003]